MEPTNPTPFPVPLEIARERRPDDIDLVTETHKRLTAANWAGAATWLDHPEIIQAKDAPPAKQRIMIAQNLQDPFLGLPTETRADRLRLNGTVDPLEFLNVIEQHIAPRLVELEPLHAAIEAKAEEMRQQHQADLAAAKAADQESGRSGTLGLLEGE